MEKKIPNFFIVGTPKAGTTSLYFYLEEHPEIFMSPIKETNYFSYNEIKEQKLYYNEEYIKTPDDYMNQFAGVKDEKAVGEASVSYLYYPSVPGKVKAFNPESRIIMVLRNPVDRGFSHYLMDKRLGFVKTSLKDIVERKDHSRQKNLYYQQYISLGCYYEQVKRYLDTFGKERVKILLYEDIVTNIGEVVKDIYSFLEVAPDYKAGTDKKHNTFLAPKNPLIEKLYASKFFRVIVKKIFGNSLQAKIKNIFFQKEKKPELDPRLKASMLEIFRDDIQKTSELIGRDLSKWLS